MAQSRINNVIKSRVQLFQRYFCEFSTRFHFPVQVYKVISLDCGNKLDRASATVDPHPPRVLYDLPMCIATPPHEFIGRKHAYCSVGT